MQLAGAQVAAQDTPKPSDGEGIETTSSVEVKGIRDPEWKSYKSMLSGMDVFDSKHELAPNAELRFILLPRRPDVVMQGLALTLDGGDTSIPIPLAEDNTFVLPRLAGAKNSELELYLNRKAKSVRWFPHVRTRLLLPTQRRLGDLRLECEVLWGVDKNTLPFFARNSIRALGGPCNFSKFKISFQEPRKLVSATLVSGDRRLSLPVSNNGESFIPPLHDKAWNDDSLIDLVFETAASAGQ